MGRWYYQRQRYWVPRQQTVRHSDGKKVVTTRFGPRDWTRTTTHPAAGKSVVSSTSNGPMTTVVGVAMLLAAPAVFLGEFSIPIYLAAVVLLVQWLNRRTMRQPRSAPPKIHQPRPAPVKDPDREEKQKMTSETAQLPEGASAWTEVYEMTAEELRQQLEDVRCDESAKSFVEEAVRQVKVAEAATSEFYPGEFYYRFQRAVRDELKAEIASCERESADISGSRDAKSADLEARLRTARDSDDQEAEHAIWREREQKQAETNAAADALIRRAALWILRTRAVDDLGVALGGSRSAAQQSPRLDTADEDTSRSRGGTGSTFWIYDNRVHQFSKIHRAECSFCNNGRGIHGRGPRAVAGSWLGPFESLGEALSAAEATGRLIDTCSVCAPPS